MCVFVSFDSTIWFLSLRDWLLIFFVVCTCLFVYLLCTWPWIDTSQNSFIQKAVFTHNTTNEVKLNFILNDLLFQ